MRTVLFLCTGNSARSQMAEGWLNHLGGGRFVSLSAGTRPQGLNPFAVRAMAEAGVDISGQRSKSVEEYLGVELDLLVTVCGGAREECPLFTGRVGGRRHWPVADPAAASGNDGEVLEAFRRARAEIKAEVEKLVEEHTP